MMCNLMQPLADHNVTERMDIVASAALFVSDTANERLEKTILEQVKGFYKEISSLICAYLNRRLQIGQILDVYDERQDWMIGCVVALRTDYVGIHYNGFGCDYDDWIHCESFRLAPLHSYSSDRFYNGFSPKEYKWSSTVYNAFLRSISPGYRDRLTPAHLSKYIATVIPQYQPAKSEQQNLVEALSTLQSYNESLRAYLHRQILQFQHSPNHLETYCPPSARVYNRAALERYAAAYRSKFRAFGES